MNSGYNKTNHVYQNCILYKLTKWTWSHRTPIWKHIKELPMKVITKKEELNEESLLTNQLLFHSLERHQTYWPVKFLGLNILVFHTILIKEKIIMWVYKITNTTSFMQLQCMNVINFFNFQYTKIFYQLFNVIKCKSA